MKNITLSVEDGLIEAAQRRATAGNTTIEALFRKWLTQYVSTGPDPDPEVRRRQAEEAMSTLHELQDLFGTEGRNFTREEMNERRQADAGDGLLANVHQNFGAAMVEKHRREGEDMLRFREFERGLGDAGQGFSQRERYLLFLEHESHLSDEGREQFLRFLQHERAYLHEYNLAALGITIPGDYDSD